MAFDESFIRFLFTGENFNGSSNVKLRTKKANKKVYDIKITLTSTSTCEFNQHTNNSSTQEVMA